MSEAFSALGRAAEKTEADIKALINEMTLELEELPDDQINPDETEPLIEGDPPKTDPVPDE